jgi:hypothetical protein
MVSALEQELKEWAEFIVAQNPRHDETTLFVLLAKWFEEATEEQIDEAVRSAL